MKSKIKLAIVSWTFAPQVSGSPILLDNLFREFKGELFAVTGWDMSAKVDSNFEPVCRKTSFKFSNEILGKIYRRLKYSFTFIVNRYVFNQIKKEAPSAVFGVYPNDIFVVASYKACRKLNIPFVVHIHDLWLENYEKGTKEYAFGSKYEKEVLEFADIVYCMTDTQLDHLKKKYNLKEVKLLPHSIPSKRINEIKKKDTKKLKNTRKKILYTGNVSAKMNLDALKTFVKVVDTLPEEYEVSMLVNYSESELKSRNLFSERIQYDWVSMEEAVRLQENADLLFLPLSHKNCSGDEVTTVFATKTLDYLLSNTPILVYGPKNSFHIKSAKKHGWGYPVDVDSEDLLYDSFLQILTDDAIVKGLIDGAIEEAKRRNTHFITQLLEDDIMKLSKSDNN
jgi:glycosyltransferase involved in cell wall biosynthesis